MKQSLQLRLGQQLTMTPQLQQAIKLLQLSTLDLQQEIQQVLDSNMMLEVIEDDAVRHGDSEMLAPKVDTRDQDTCEGSQTDIPDELAVDSSWEDVYDGAQLAMNNPVADVYDFEAQRTKSETLPEHLLWQLELTQFTERDLEIAKSIIDSINGDGYLMSGLNDIYIGLQPQLDSLDFDEVVAVLHSVQNFDPAGVAALNLQDCLRLQLLQVPVSNPYRDKALELVVHYLDLLAAQEQSKLLKRLNVNEQELTHIIALVRSLDPKPGAKIQESEEEYIIPDVYVTKVSGQWQVQLNPDIAPKLRINPVYSGMIKRSDSSQDNNCMKNHLQEARWFIKSLHSRNDTLLRVARSIVEKQGDFLEHGSIAMRPMVLKSIAAELELHESTISRITTQKYMHTPNGIVEFKYFFSSHVGTEVGGECSAIAIRAFIKELIASENAMKPLSDDKIAKLLQEKGIIVARRTVAKYREAMFIQSSSQRKRIM
ncbi:MAG: RNA polymerase factor sigma-54 [Methylococcaceae bacterium]|nr:RNA polymerase factor sigma-54 [Methylococcaceae bacterium]